MTRQDKLTTIAEIKKQFGWTNNDIAEKLDSTGNYVKNALAPNSQKALPKWADAMIAVYQAMKK